MVLLSVLLLLWGVPFLNAADRLRRFYLNNDPNVAINEALNDCISNYTDLPTVLLNNKCSWIGATSCKWSNGDPVTFIDISNTFKEENCGAIITGGGWDFFNCDSTKMYFMCSHQDRKQQSYNYSLIRENKTWVEAQLSCRENHTDLVSIRNETENQRVMEAGNGSNSFWTGLRYNDSVDWFNHSDYIHEFMPITKGCFTILSLPGSMSKNNSNGYSALCYKSLIHVSPGKMSWEKALDYCNKYSGLLSIQSENDQTVIERELKSRNIAGPVWVGLRQSRLFGFWMWTNGLFIGSWSNWKGGSQPQHQTYCGAIEEVDGHYKWCDKDCRSEFTVLCEKK